MKGYDQIKAKGGPYDSLIQAASANYGVPYELLHKQLFKESSFNPKAVSPTGPRGLAQMTKATGAAYGLHTDEDFFDPDKSIDAAARHMRDNIKIAGGDQLKALLLYNQGGGRVGRAQIDAYDRGDFSGISKEGLGYMRDLMDVSESGKKDELSAFVKQASGFEAPAGVEAVSQVERGNVPFSGASFALTGKDLEPKAKPFAQTLFETTGKTEDEELGLFDGVGNNASVSLQTSVLGMLIRAATENPEADFTKQFTMLKDVFNEPLNMGRLSDWTDEDYQKLRTSGLDPQFYDVVLRGYRRNFDDNLKLALDNQRLIQSTSQDRIGASLVGGMAGMAGDPWSLVSPGKGAAGNVGARLLGGALAGGALGGLSEHSAAKASGREEHLGMAIAGGAAFGSALNGAFGSRPGSLAPDDMSPADLLALANSKHNEEQALVSTASRLESRERARLEGRDDDPTAMPFREGEEVHQTESGRYIDTPFDDEAVRTTDGSILSGGSPINPKTIETFKELHPEDRANTGVALGGLTEIGLTLGRSTNDEVRAVAYDLFRAPTGYKDGSNGKFGATASDIVERLRSQDNVVHNRLFEGVEETLKDPFWHAQDLSKGAKMETISRRVVEALESQKTTGLTPPELKLLETLRDHMNRKWDYISNPAQFGNLSAKALLEDTRLFSTYFPQRYSTAAKHQAIARFGGEEGLQEAIAHSWMASYLSRPEVRQRIDKMVTEAHERATKGNPDAKPLTPEQIREAVEKYAKDKAYGISHSDRFNASSVIEEHLKDGAGIENNDYLEARNLFDSDMSIQAPDGGMFSVNDLRDFNLLRVVPQYDRRVNGDIAIMGGTGKTTKELKDLANSLRMKAPVGREQQDADALMEALKMLTGRARRDPDGAWGALARSLNDVGFMTKNAYMGPQNITEAASLITKGHLKMLLKGVPLLKKWSTADAKLTPEDVRDLHGVVFGRELDDVIRPSRQDIVDSLRVNSSEIGAQVAGSIKWATGEASVRSPFTWLLRESGNYLLDAGRQGVLVDLVNHTLNGKETALFSPERLRSASISPEQFKGIQSLIKDHFSQDQSGKWRINDAGKLAADPRSMDLYRLGDRVADETILRPHKMSMAATKQYGPGLAMVMQFKMFVMRSLNGRLVRGWMEATKNRQALDQTMQSVVSLGLAAGFYYASTQAKAYALPERERRKYLEKALSPSMVTYAAISRSSHVGAPLGVSNYITAPLGFDQAAMVRTSILPRGDQKKQDGKPIRNSPLQSDLVGGFMGRLAEQVPGAGVLASGVQAGYSGMHLLQGNRGEDLQGHRTGLWNALKQFVPNDPVSQSLMRRLAEDQGVDRVR